jgi:N-acetylneuraminic acid mutarotase
VEVGVIRIEWSLGRSFPSYIKGGAMGIVDDMPVYAAGMGQPWRESELAWYLDSEIGDWMPAPPMPLGRCYTTGTTAGDGFVVLGGRKNTGHGLTILNDAWWLRRTDGVFSWTELPNMSQPRAVAAAAEIGNLVVVLGGGDWERVVGGAFVADSVTTVEALDLSDPSGGWADVGEPPFSPRVNLGAATAGGKLYVIGGYNCHVDDQKVRHISHNDDVFSYDPTTGDWAEHAPMPVKWYGGQAVAYDDRYIVVTGGVVELPICGQEVRYHTMTADKRAGILGGYSDLVWIYDTVDDRWHLDPQRVPVGLNDVHGCIDGNMIYLVGGENVDPTTSNTTDTVVIGTISE